ncbi:hypothetical protein MMC11_008404 [Xylographa trunciseda]|nr:hypothetical protein [Xylographa trunciseda]
MSSSETDIDMEIGDESPAEDVERILAHLRAVIACTQQQLVERHPDLLLSFKSSLESLPYLVSGDQKPSKEGKGPSKGYANPQIPAPHITCSEELSWAAFPDLIAEALEQGAKEAGGFLVTLDPSTPGYDWAGIEGDSNRVITCQKSRLSHIKGSDGDGAYRIEIVADQKFRFDLSEVKSWPAHSASPSLAALQFVRFDRQLLDARSKREAYVGPPYAINKDAQTSKEREALGLQSNSPLFNIKGNRLEKTARILRGIHTPEAFVSTAGWGTPFGVHVEEFYFHAINYHVCGAPKLWCLIPEQYSSQFEDLMAAVNKRHRKCDQFVRHDYTWPARNMLDIAGIRYSLIY